MMMNKTMIITDLYQKLEKGTKFKANEKLHYFKIFNYLLIINNWIKFMVSTKMES